MTDIYMIERYLGIARLTPYLESMGDDIDGAVALYRWNTELAGALHAPLSHLEIIVRNSMDRELSEWNAAQGLPSRCALEGNAAEPLYLLLSKAL
ncbi:hypothetical protein [Gordonia phthalatica]|uniref:hypothetical protein n=1 Tax=Gordonia phthalatica TaxID=1136941 RepID=UPI001872365D|nr:hypothetical protein [Gordonia phthalatica]